jgi:methyltransferase-like protein
MSAASVTNYDELPYPNHVFYYTHPEWLATIAMLLGMTPAPVQGCRVLELGCASGANLLPMSLALPESRFIGIDLSARQIASGQAVIQELGLRNVELKQQSILDVDESLGRFDYIICHGVYSWVPAGVRDKILAICAANLAPQGVAYVSYNTYPGWHLRGLVRDQLCFHVAQFPDPRGRVEQARAFLSFLTTSVPDPNSLYAHLLKIEADLLAGETDAYFFHEQLEEVNQPVYFHEFARRAADVGLRYLAEAKFDPQVKNLRTEVKQKVVQLSGDPIHQEQYLDFLCNRKFRRSLLCHDDVSLDPMPALEKLSACWLTAVAQPTVSDSDLGTNGPLEFRTNDGVSLSLSHPVAKAALVALADAWPQSLSLADLAQQVRTRLGSQAPAEFARSLSAFLLQAYLSTIVELHLYVPLLVVQAGERPEASPLARLQARTESRVTNLRHRGIELSKFDRLVLGRLDGKHDRPALLEELVDLVARGEFTMHKDDGPILDDREIRSHLAAALDESLRGLARSALLLH